MNAAAEALLNDVLALCTEDRVEFANRVLDSVNADCVETHRELRSLTPDEEAGIVEALEQEARGEFIDGETYFARRRARRANGGRTIASRVTPSAISTPTWITSR